MRLDHNLMLGQQCWKKRTVNPIPKKNKRTEAARYTIYILRKDTVVRITEMINVNRNTINEDIKYWYAQISRDFQSSNLPGLCALKQHNRLESQHGRLVSELEKQERLKDKILLERMILDVDLKISELAQKIGLTRIRLQSNTEKIQKIVKRIVLDSVFPAKMKKEEYFLR